MNNEDILKNFLELNGFKFQPWSHLTDDRNTIKWIAYRPINHDLRDCECNDKPPQLVINPYEWFMNDNHHFSCEIEITGEYNGLWFQLKSYSISLEDIMTNLDGIELMLSRSWNAIKES
jgi:hypothetical protein